MTQLSASPGRPERQDNTPRSRASGRELAPFVHDDPLRRPTLLHQPIPGADDALCSKLLPDFNGQSFAAAHLHDSERTEALSIAQLYRDEVLAPGVFGYLRL